jgi:hypothetical protein
MAYVFGNFGGGISLPGLGGPSRPADVALSDLMISYWVNFAKKGDPDGPGLPPWPAFTPAAQNAMHFDAKPSVRPVHAENQDARRVLCLAAPTKRGHRASTEQRARAGLQNPTKSAKPPPPVQIRAESRRAWSHFVDFQ